MFEVGFTEIILILGLALLVLGPEKLPGLAEKVGRWTGRARTMARQLRTQLEHEVTMEELAKSRASQPASPPPGTPEADAHAYSDIGAASSDAEQQHSAPAQSEPGLDLDTMVSGVEPARSDEAAPAAESPGEVPLTKPAP